MEYIIAVDPGGTTGIAYWSKSSDTFRGQPVERTDKHLVVEGIEHYAEALGGLLTVVCETYTITARTAKLSQQTDALKIIGVLEYFVEKYGIRLIMQSPSDAKRFSTNQRLKAADMWMPTKGGHANDAQRHLFMYLVKHGLVNIGEIDARRT